MKNNIDEKLREILNHLARYSGYTFDDTRQEKIDQAISAIKSLFPQELNKDKFIEICSQLADDYFPKGQCKERGQLLVFIAQLWIKLVEEV